MRPMRQAHLLVDDPAVLHAWLADARVGRLATIGEDGYPVIKPVTFAHSDGKIFFHSSSQGEKLDDIRRDARVGFEIDHIYAITPASVRGCQTHCFYRSVVIRGNARILEGEADRSRKELGLRLLIGKYSPAFVETPLNSFDRVAVVEITIESISGKKDVGQNWPAGRRLDIAGRLLARDGTAAEDAISGMGFTLDEVLEHSEKIDNSATP